MDDDKKTCPYCYKQYDSEAEVRDHILFQHFQETDTAFTVWYGED